MGKKHFYAQKQKEKFTSNNNAESLRQSALTVTRSRSFEVRVTVLPLVTAGAAVST